VYLKSPELFKRLTCRHRHTFQFRDSDIANLGNCHPGQPEVVRDAMLKRINRPSEPGLVVDCSLAWECLAKRAKGLAAGHTASRHAINTSNLILGLLRN
jgi:hypothetical protein